MELILTHVTKTMTENFIIKKTLWKFIQENCLPKQRGKTMTPKEIFELAMAIIMVVVLAGTFGGMFWMAYNFDKDK